MATPPKLPRFLYKILPSSMVLPVPLPASGTLPQTSLDIDSGFIHFSTSAQVSYVLNRFFAGSEHGSVWLVKIDYADLEDDGNVKWEEAGSDKTLFAHLYDGEVKGSKVVEARKVEMVSSWDESLQGLADEGWLLD
ncbi:MAG: hypothetical protein L6R42_002025 [Xanthoria sp. 1 TBL-2021]|nr:MAG: hypothetical protein L6R42_002025 [Xanthoria sp. 1 TBL-2021]